MVGSVTPTGVATRLTARVATRTVRFGSTVPVTGELTAGSAPLAHQQVLVQAFIGRRWRTVATPSTDDAGALTAIIKPLRNRSLRARYAGLGDLRAASSPTFAVGVRPILAISRTVARAASGARVVVRGRVRPRKARVYQVLQQKRGRGFRTIATRAVKTRRDGRFQGFFVPGRAGTYRFYVVARADAKTARAATPKYRVRVGRSRGGGTGAP
jgi:hypothetical protein